MVIIRLEIPSTTRAPAVLTNTKPANLQWVVPNGKAPMAPKAHGGGEEEIGMLTRYFFFGASTIMSLSPFDVCNHSRDDIPGSNDYNMHCSYWGY